MTMTAAPFLESLASTKIFSGFTSTEVTRMGGVWLLYEEREHARFLRSHKVITPSGARWVHIVRTSAKESGFGLKRRGVRAMAMGARPGLPVAGRLIRAGAAFHKLDTLSPNITSALDSAPATPTVAGSNARERDKRGICHCGRSFSNGGAARVVAS